ncbi:porin [Alsobacter sp. R-9]
MRLSTLLLSSAALVASGTVGFAADLPSKKAAPVEYVRVCSQFGAGFFYIPGSDTCLKVSGRIRADYAYAEQFTRGNSAATSAGAKGDAVTLRARGYLALDSYTATDWGPVRATTRIYVTKDSGSAATTTLDWAYIQFAGITAGRLATSMFEFAPFGGISYLGGGANGRGSDLGSVNALAYTATFGGGFSATLSLEDGTERRVGINNVSDNLLVSTMGSLTGVAGQPTFGGNVMPDVVGRLDYTAGWGQVALTGAVHQTRVGSPSAVTSSTQTAPAGGGALVTNNVYGNSYGGLVGDTEYGFAVQGGVKINLPMLAPGDALFMQAAYATGANSYTGWGTAGFGTVSLPTADVMYDTNGNGHLTQSWSVTGGMLHYWIPTVRQGLYAAYGAVDQYGPWYDMSAFSIGTNLIWSPVKGLDIGAEVGWQSMVDKPNYITLARTSTSNPFYGANDSQWFGRLRFQRDF